MLFTPPIPLSQTVTPSRTPSPLERDVLYGRPLYMVSILLIFNELIACPDQGAVETHFKKPSF